MRSECIIFFSVTSERNIYVHIYIHANEQKTRKENGDDAVRMANPFYMGITRADTPNFDFSHTKDLIFSSFLNFLVPSVIIHGWWMMCDFSIRICTRCIIISRGVWRRMNRAWCLLQVKFRTFYRIEYNINVFYVHCIYHYHFVSCIYIQLYMTIESKIA